MGLLGLAWAVFASGTHHQLYAATDWQIRDAVLATATHCTHPGCTVPATRCQIDHMHPASHGGCTSTYNGCVRCGHHNRWRHRTGATVTRHPDGTIITHRADGTRIAPPL